MPTRTAKYSYRAEPTTAQRQWLAGAYGAARVVYNDYLWQREKVYRGEASEIVSLDRFKLLSADKQWLKEYSQKTLQQSVRHAEIAYRNFFHNLGSKRKVGKPQFKRRRSGGSLTWNGVSLQVRRLNSNWGAVRLPKDGSWLKFRSSRPLPNEPTGVTLKLSPAGEYTVSFTIQQQITAPKTSGLAAGVDPGLTDLVSVVKGDGSRYKMVAPRGYRRSERKLARLQREFSRKAKGSANRERARLAVARQHAKVARQRLDYNRKIASRLARENQAVSLEDLSVASLTKSRLSKSFGDAGLGGLKATIAAACEREGSALTLVAPAYTSQTCGVCGAIDGPKPLSIREWQCACGARLDRDYNAALNVLLLAGGHSERLNGSEGRVRREELASPADPAVSAEGATSYRAHRPSRRRTRAKSQARRTLLKAQASV